MVKKIDNASEIVKLHALLKKLDWSANYDTEVERREDEAEAKRLREVIREKYYGGNKMEQNEEVEEQRVEEQRVEEQRVEEQSAPEGDVETKKPSTVAEALAVMGDVDDKSKLKQLRKYYQSVREEYKDLQTKIHDNVARKKEFRDKLKELESQKE